MSSDDTTLHNSAKKHLEQAKEAKINQYLIDDSVFVTPEMGDFYLGAVDTDYLRYLDSLLNGEEHADAKKAAYYTESPVSKDCGYVNNKRTAMFLKAEVVNNWNTVDGGWVNGNELLIKIGSLSVDGNTSKKATSALQDITAILKQDGMKNNDDPPTDEDFFSFQLYGIDAKKPPKWAYESNVKKGAVGISDYTVDYTYPKEKYEDETNSDIPKIIYSIHETGDIIKTATITGADNSSGKDIKEINFTNGNETTAESSFRWCVQRGDYDYTLAYKASKKMSEILDKVGNTVYLMIDFSYQDGDISTMADDMFDSSLQKGLLNNIAETKHGALNGYCLSRTGKLYGEAYVKIDNQWCNLAKMVLAEVDDSDAVSHTEVNADTSIFQNSYDPDICEWADAFKSLNDEIDDRKKIQAEIFGKEWDAINDWTVSLGDVTFMAPPTNITVISHIEDERVPLIRANGSMSKSGKHTTKNISMTIFFTKDNEGINGYEYKTKMPNGEETTYYMNGLRALVAQFKFTPFLPIENKYINDTLGIEAVVFNGMQISSVERMPGLYQVTLSLLEFDYTVYMSELIKLCVSWGCESNYFATAFNWPVFRFYYQRCLQRGEEVAKYSFNTDEYNKLIIKNRTSLQPMSFTDSSIKFYVADEDYLQAMWTAKMSADTGRTARVDFTTNDEKTIEGFSQLASQIINHINSSSPEQLSAEIQEVINRINTTPLVDHAGNRYTTSAPGKSLFELSMEKEEYWPLTITAVKCFNINKTDSDGKDVTILRAVINLEGGSYTDDSEITSFKQKCLMYMGNTDSSFTKRNTIVLDFVPTKDDNGEYTAYSLDTTTMDMKFLAFCYQHAKQEYYLNNLDKDTQTENGWFINTSIASFATMKFTDYPIGTAYIRNIEATLTNQITGIHLAELDSSSPQYMGGQDIQFRIDLTTSDKKTVQALTNLPKFATNQLKKYRQVIPSYPVRIDCEFTKFLGVNDVIIDDIQASTIERNPGVYDITIILTSVDRTLRQREAMAMIDATNQSDDAYSDSQGLITTYSYFTINDTIAKAELYPDLELPTLEEMEKMGWKFTRYKFQDERIYVDPDFYILYLTRLTSEMIRESVLKSIEEGNGNEMSLNDNTGASVEASFSAGQGITVTKRNDEAQSQHDKVQQMKQAQKELNAKELKENLSKTYPNSDDDEEVKSWSICSSIKCMFLENKYKREYDTYIAQLKANAVENDEYDPASSETAYDMTQQAEVDKLIKLNEGATTTPLYANKMDENLKTDKSVAEGKWVASRLSQARDASQKIAEYLQGTPIDDSYKLSNSEECIAVRNRDFKENPTYGSSITSLNLSATIKDKIYNAVESFLDDSDVRAVLKTIPIEVSDKFIETVQDLVYASACTATGEKEYSAKENSTNWHPSTTYLGEKEGGKQDTAIDMDVSTIDEGVEKAIAFGIFKIKMYDATEYQRITGNALDLSGLDDGQQLYSGTEVNNTRSLLDPYYRSSVENASTKISEYKKNCMESIPYCTVAYMRLLLYWIMRMLDRQIYPSFVSDLFRDVTDAELTVIQKASEMGLVGEKMSSLANSINLYKSNIDMIDAGKIWTAALYTLTDNDPKIDKYIQDRNYKALDSYIFSCAKASRKVDHKDISTMVVRKMILALVGLERIEEMSALGVSQDDAVAKETRARMQQKYIAMAEDPSKYTIHSCHDMIVYDARGRLLRAFPTYYMVMIDEGRTIGSYKLHDNFYNNMALSEIEVVKSRKLPADTAHIVMSNIYSTFINESEDSYDMRNIDFSPTKFFDNVSLVFSSVFTPTTFGAESEEIRQQKKADTKILLTPGTRIHLRMGYGSNAAMMPIVFNGSIAEVNTNEVVEIIAQGDGVELMNPIMEDMQAYDLENNDDFFTGSHTIDNGSTPKEIMTALLTTRGGWWAKFLQTVGRPDLLGRNPYGLYHFGNPDFTTIFENGETTQNIFEVNKPPSITFEIFGKTVWDIANICKSVDPTFICGVVPFGFRSTLFMGAYRYYYAYEYMRSNGLILEKRKPYQQYHFYTSGTDIIGNGIVATSRDMKTNATGLYQVSATLNRVEQHKVGPLFADIDIYPENQKSMIVDTQLLGKGIPIIGNVTNFFTSFETIDSFFDDEGSVVSNEKIAWKMTASALKESMMDMYAGDLVVLGDPSVKPHDRMKISDTYESIEGQCLVKEVIHHMSGEQGFITTISPDCIITINGDDANTHEESAQHYFASVSGLAMPAIMTIWYMCRAKKLGYNWGLKSAWEKFTTKSMQEKISQALSSNTANSVKKFASKVTDKVVSTAAKALAKREALSIMGSFIIKRLMTTALMTGAVALLGPVVGTSVLIGAAIFVGFSILCRSVTHSLENFIKNMEVAKVFPLKHYGKVLTAGMNGSKGVIIGSPTEKQQGVMSTLFGKICGRNSGDGADDYLADALKWLTFGDDVMDAGAVLRKDENDQLYIANTANTSQSTETIQYSFDDILKGYSNYGNKSENARNDYRKMMLSPRIDYEDSEALSLALNRFSMKKAKYWRDDTKLKNNKCIVDDERLKSYIQEGFFKIIHETPALNDGANVDSQTVKIDGKERYIKVIVQTLADGKTLTYDIPMLHPDAMNILYEIVRRTRTAMSSENSSDPQATFEKNKNSFILLESALRAGDTTSLASTGFSFTLRGVEQAAKPLAIAIVELHEEIAAQHEKSPRVFTAPLFDSKDVGDNRTSVTVRMPTSHQQVTLKDKYGEVVLSNSEDSKDTE